MAQPPVIVVPGITATTLSDYYPLPPEELWTAVLAKKYQRIALHPDDVRYEAVEPARVQPENVFALVYGDLIDALRHDLSEKRDLPTPVFGFAYDWRQDCSRSAEQLSSFIDEVLTRTALLPHYQDKTFRVDLVGHSMGGLIIADYLARYGQEKKVRRVVSIGSPFEGSLDAVLKLTIGKGTLTGESPRDREREAARTIPAIYQLLPTFKGAVRAAQGLSADLFSVETWQPSILQTLGEYIRLHKARTKARSLFKQYLDGAKRFRERIRQVDLQGVLPEGKKGWLPIVGVGSPTQVRVKISRWHEKPWLAGGHGYGRRHGSF
jgi:pimeloyl-ACP methyl ester carboxylesterase